MITIKMHHSKTQAEADELRAQLDDGFRRHGFHVRIVCKPTRRSHYVYLSGIRVLGTKRTIGSPNEWMRVYDTINGVLDRLQIGATTFHGKCDIRRDQYRRCVYETFIPSEGARPQIAADAPDAHFENRCWNHDVRCSVLRTTPISETT